MAAGGSDLSTRISTENKSICDIALSLFKTYKVEISDAINTTFPFLEYLRDHGFITNEIYKDSLQSYTKRYGVQEVIYDVLTELEKTFDLSFLAALFSKVIMKKYPDLNNIYKIFKTAIPDLKLFPEYEMEQRPGVQLSLEQGTVTKSLKSLTWVYQDPSNYNGTALPENGLAEPLRETQLIHGNETVPTTSGNNSVLETQQANEQRAQESEPAGIKKNNSKKRKSPTSGKRLCKTRRSLDGPSGACSSARRGLDGPSGACSTARRSLEGPSGACSSARRSLEGASRACSSAVRGLVVAKPPGAFSCAPKSDLNEKGTIDLGNNSTLEKARKKRRTIQHNNTRVNLHSEILLVTCGSATGMLIKRKLERGVTMKCIRSDDGNWFSFEELKIRGGCKSNWKISVRCGGKPLRQLIKEGILPAPPRVYGRRRLENSEKCKICQDEGILFCCNVCLGFFHGNCHLPPVQSERNPWRCTFCTIRMRPRSHRCYKESEILRRQMGSEEKLKCDFVLLKVYCHLESNIFPNIPHENYFEEASQCLEKLRKLDEIKRNLIEGQYRRVEEFVQAMNLIFQDPRCNDSDLTEAEFKKHFKEVFAI